jgi:predicted RNA-binding Zn ribbon-like protein
MLSIGTPIIVRIPVIRLRRYHMPMDAIDLVAEFLNSYDLETGADGLATADGLSAWAAEHGVMAPGSWISPQDAAAARELREALRRALETGGRDIAGLDAAAARLPLVALPGDGGRISLVSARGGPDDVRAAVLEAVLTSQADGSWPRLKVCRNPDCRWAFADRSKNRSRAWCDMATCGSRSKMRAYRSRRA